MTTYWNFRQLLDVNPDGPGFTCVGTTKKGLRCRQFFFSNSDLYEAARILDTMDRQKNYSDACIHLEELAELTLCPRWHRNPGYSQTDEVSYKWQVTIEEHVARRKQAKLRQMTREKKQREAAARARAEDPIIEYITPPASPVLVPVRSESTCFGIQPLPTVPYGQPSFSQHTAQVHGLPTPEATPERELPQSVQDVSPSKMASGAANQRHNLTPSNNPFISSNTNGPRMFGQPKAAKDLSNLGSTSDVTKPVTSLPGDNTKTALNTSFQFGPNKENQQIPFSFESPSALPVFNVQVQEQSASNIPLTSHFGNVVEPLFSSAKGKEMVQKTTATDSIPEHRKEVRPMNTEIESLIINATSPEDIHQLSLTSPLNNAVKKKKRVQIFEATEIVVSEPTPESIPEQLESIQSTPQEVETPIIKTRASETSEVLPPTPPPNSISASAPSTTQEAQSPAPKPPITKKPSFGYADITPPSKHKIHLPTHYRQPAFSSSSPQTLLHNPNGLFGDFIIETTFKFSTSQVVRRKPLPISKDAIIHVEESPEICLRCGMRDDVCGCDGSKDEDEEGRTGCLSLGLDRLKKSLRKVGRIRERVSSAVKNTLDSEKFAVRNRDI